MTISQLTDAVEAHLLNKKYAGTTVMSYRHRWNQLCLFAKYEGVEVYTFDYGLRFAKLHYGIDFSILEPPFSNSHHFLYKALKSLDEYQQGLPLTTYQRPPKEPLPEPYRDIVGRYMESYSKRNLVRRSINMASYTLRKFSEFLCEANILDINEITATNICDFASTLKDYVATTRNSWLSRLKDFLKFAYEEKCTSKNISIFVPKPRYMPAPKLPSVYSKEEIERLLNAVDRANPKGKRDFAILMIASSLGMRSGDIANLKYENFDWNKNEIRFIQQKGGQPHTLPLFNNVGESIIDYLKNGRPQIESPHIFLKHNAPFTVLSAAALHPIMNKYRKLAKLPNDPPRKAGLHALRHSLASSLLEDSTPLPVISEVLGHKKTETTRIYTNIDVISLKKCALEVPVPIEWGFCE